MRIEEGKFYRTRDGQKVGPMVPSGDWGYPWTSARAARTYTDEGQLFASARSECDIVAEWADEKPIEQEVEDDEILAIAAATDIKAEIADEAKRIVSGARRSAYGTPEQNFERIARFWTAYMLNTGRDVEITAADVSPLMVLLKVARLCETPDHRDSHVDLVGYALTGAEVAGVKGAAG